MAIQIGKYKRPGIFIEEFDNSVISSPTVAGISTVVIGFSKAKNTVLTLSLIPILCVVYYLKVYLFDAKLLYSFIYGLIFIVTPLIYFSIKIFKANEPKEFRHLNIILKCILFFAYLSIFVISLNIQNHAEKFAIRPHQINV